MATGKYSYNSKMELPDRKKKKTKPVKETKVPTFKSKKSKS
jgi:hypothetical protein